MLDNMILNCNEIYLTKENKLMQNLSPIAVIGAGSWGTALAIHLAGNHQEVHLWGHNKAEMQTMQQTRCNQRYLSNITLPKNLILHLALEDAVKVAKDILIVVPSHAFRITLNAIKPLLVPDARIVWATKGLDHEQHQLLHEIVKEILEDIPSAILSGPSFAKEVAQHLPTAITIASKDIHFSHDLITRFHNKDFRVYTCQDLIGVQLGGAMKNVLAIAVGMADGLGYGANARAALITRGLTEMARLGLALGGQTETFMGLAGLGDLVLTCTDNQSRNRRFGLALGGGKSRAIAEQEIGQVVEGIRTAEEIYHVAKKAKVETPICDQIYQVLYQNLTPEKAAQNLLAREPKMEQIT